MTTQDKLASCTARQREIYHLIEKFIEEKGYAPTFRELTACSTIRSHSTIYWIVNKLKELGLLTYEDGVTRSITLVKPAPCIRTVVAQEQEGLDVRTLVLTFEVPDKDFDLISAVKAAATEFCQTEEGRVIFEGNCDYFNWGDFAAYVPNAFCEKHGFKRCNWDIPDTTVYFDEQLVNDEDIHPEDESET